MHATILLIEVLQGFTSTQDFNQGKKLLTSLPMIELVGGDIAFQAANNFGKLRTFGITIRKTIDTFIATSCIALRRDWLCDVADVIRLNANTDGSKDA